jgi:hypothetical protein
MTIAEAAVEKVAAVAGTINQSEIKTFKPPCYQAQTDPIPSDSRAT